MGIDSLIAQLESAGENIILIRMQMLNMGNSVLLLKRTGTVSYSDGRFLKNLKGVKFERDTDWIVYSPDFVGMGFGVDLMEAYVNGVNGFSADIRIGDELCVSYLKQTGDWDTDGGLRFGCDDRWEKALGAIDLIVHNAVKPLYPSPSQ